jgi:signal transduction histidine kinase
VAACVLLAPAVVCPDVISARETQKRVLVIYTTRRDTQFSSMGDRELPGLLERAAGAKIDYYAEYLDGARFTESQYAEAFANYLQLKYRGSHFDAIIATHALAFDFVSAHRDALFPKTPVVFFADDPQTSRFPNSAGLIAARSYGATVDLALALQPDTREVYVIVGNSARDQAAERMVRAQLASYDRGVRFTYLSGLTIDDVEDRLKTLPEHAVAYYVLFYQDSAGVNVTPLEYLDRLSAITSRPLYSWVDSTIGHGVVGGGFASQSLQIRAIADLAGRVLRGEPVDNIPILTPDTMQKQVDWRQLQRWDMAEARVPAGTSVLFRTPTAWERYRFYIVVASVLMLAQSALIAILLVQRRRLRTAEETVRHGQADLRASREQIRDLGGRLLAAQDSERSRIALELHDDISQQLAVLTMNLQMLCGFGSSHEDDAELVAREALGHADGIAHSLRDLSHRLYPTKLRLLGLVPAIASLEHDVSRADVMVRFTHEDVPLGLPHELTLALYRVVQEALKNAITHSDAREVRVHLEGRGGALFLSIVDDGVGFDVETALGEGLGLISMRERLDSVGGSLTIKSIRGAGTRIEIVVANAGVHAAATLAV